eukprot:1156745-Pelagomonas_calceolata.AAC.3
MPPHPQRPCKAQSITAGPSAAPLCTSTTRAEHHTPVQRHTPSMCLRDPFFLALSARCPGSCRHQHHLCGGSHPCTSTTCVEGRTLVEYGSHPIHA